MGGDRREVEEMARRLARRDPALTRRIEELARARGQTLEEWLEHALGELRRGEMEAALPRADDAAFREVALQMRALLGEAGETSNATTMERTMEQELATIVHRLESREEAIQHQLQRLASHLEELTGHLEHAQAPAAREGVEERDVLARISRQVERAEVRMAEAIGDLNERLQAVAERAEEALRLAADARDGEGEAREWMRRLQALEEQLAEMREKALAPDAQMLPLKELLDGIEQVRQVGEELPARVEDVVMARATRRLEEFETRVEEMLRQTDGRVRELAGGLEQVDRLGRELARLDEELSDLAHAVAKMRASGEGGEGSMSASDARAVREALQLLSARLEEKADGAALSDLAGRVEELATGLARDADGDERLRALEEQVLHLKDMLQQALGEPLALATERLAEHEERLGALDEGLRRISGLEQAVARLQDALGASAAGGGDADQLQALAHGLDEVRALAERADGEARAMLEQVRDTLQDIIERLARLERAEERMAPDVAPRDPARALLGEEAPAAAPAAVEAASCGADPAPAGDTVVVDPGEVAATVAALSETPRKEGAAWEERRDEKRREEDGDFTRRQHSAARQMDFIAAARRAALAAREEEGAGSGSLLERLKALAARRAGNTAQQPSRADEASSASVADGMASISPNDDEPSRRGGLARHMSRLVSLERFRRAPSSGVPEGSEEGAQPASGRRRLLVAGLVLLAAVALYVSKGNKPTPPRGAAQTTIIQPVDKARALADADAASTPAPARPPLSSARAVTSEVGMATPSSITTASITPPPSETEGEGDIGAKAATEDASGARRVAAVSGGEENVAAAPRVAERPDPAALPATLGTPALRMAASSGDPRAQLLVAMHYLRGEGVARDATRAAWWLRQAAARGLTVAQYRLGTLHEKGLGVRRDAREAARWYERAALAGNVKAMHNLGVLLASGALGAAEPERAAHWFERAARHGVRDSQFNLAVLHHRGLGVKRDLTRAWFWYELAAAQGDDTARRQADLLAEHLGRARLRSMREKLAAFRPAPVVRNANVVVMERPEWRRATVASRNDGRVAPSRADSARAVSSASGEVELVRRAQRLLARLGYDVGPIDGILGNRTANAIRLFQMQRRLPVNGRPDARLLRELERLARSRA